MLAETRSGRSAGVFVAPAEGSSEAPPSVVVPYAGFKAALDAIAASAKEGGRVVVSATGSHLTLRAGRDNAGVPCTPSMSDTISPRLAHTSADHVLINADKLRNAWQAAAYISQERDDADVLSNVAISYDGGKLSLIGCDRARGTRLVLNTSDEGDDASAWSVLIPSKQAIPYAADDFVSIGPVPGGFLLAYPRLTVLLPVVSDPYPGHIVKFFDTVETTALATATEVVLGDGGMSTALASVAYVAADAGSTAVITINTDGRIHVSGPKGQVEAWFEARTADGSEVKFGIHPAMLRSLLSNAIMQVKSLWFMGAMNPICVVTTNEAGEKETMMIAPCRMPGGDA